MQARPLIYQITHPPVVNSWLLHVHCCTACMSRMPPLLLPGTVPERRSSTVWHKLCAKTTSNAFRRRQCAHKVWYCTAQWLPLARRISFVDTIQTVLDTWHGSHMPSLRALLIGLRLARVSMAGLHALRRGDVLVSAAQCHRALLRRSTGPYTNDINFITRSSASQRRSC